MKDIGVDYSTEMNMTSPTGDATLAGRPALITVGSRGIGFAIAEAITARGGRAAVTGRNVKDLDRARERLGESLLAIQADVRDPEAATRAVDETVERFGALDVLVNNAGVGAPHVSPEDTAATDLRDVFEANVLGPIRVTNAFLPLLRAAENPRIVMVSSGMGLVAVVNDPRHAGMVPPMLGYPASKSALNMVTVQYANALDGIKVNAVDPGYTATDMTDHAGFQTVTEGTDAIVRLAGIGADGPTGGFFNREGSVSW
jgi:NAD(P)-dependent dehydrogenase (short-subunit alcohol dehydrogenase family)